MNRELSGFYVGHSPRPMSLPRPLNLPNEELWRTGANAYEATVKAIVPTLWVVFRGELWQAQLVTSTFKLQLTQKVRVVGRSRRVLQIAAIPSL